MADSEKTATRSVGDLENKEMGVGESNLPSASASVHERTTDEKEHDVKEKRDSKASNSDEEDFEYPTKWKLAIITLALCLSVFCMALVGPMNTLVLFRMARLTMAGQHNHRNSHSSHYRSIQSAQ